MKYLVSIILFLSFSIDLRSQTIQHESDNYLIIVGRPCDIWTGDLETMSEQLKAIHSKSFSYSYSFHKKNFRGSPSPIQSISDHVISNLVTKKIEMELGGKLRYKSGNYFYVHEAVDVALEDMPKLIAAQTAFYKLSVIHQGNPDTVTDRLFKKKVTGNIFAAAATMLMASKFGTLSGAQMSASSGMASDVSKLPLAFGRTFAPFEMPDIDYSGYKKIELRNLGLGGDNKGFVGQILIAYKGEKTDADEIEALSTGIVIASGLTAKPGEIEAARDADFQRRKSVWAECVATSDPVCKE